MKRIILAIISVLFSITLSYAESCSCGQGCLSYQISGCGEQSRACCTGQWCSWGTSSCASCTATTQACSGNVTNACAGNRTRSVTGSCGSTCTYSGWNDSGCSYTQSCTATSESRNCSGNVSGATSGTQTRSRSVTNSCGSCSYGDWGNWSGTCVCDSLYYFWKRNNPQQICTLKYEKGYSHGTSYGYTTLSGCSSSYNYLVSRFNPLVKESSVSMETAFLSPTYGSCAYYDKGNTANKDFYVVYQCKLNSNGLYETGYLLFYCLYSSEYIAYLAGN